MKSTTPDLTWARGKVAEIRRKNNIGNEWIVFNRMTGVSAMDTEATSEIVVAFDEAGYEMQQPPERRGDWIIRQKPN